jgi:tRNA nucleotidyltransferase/poly(A) polymerase
MEQFGDLFSVILNASQSGEHIYLVGGALRDYLLGRVSHDLDFAVQGNCRRLGRKVADALGGAFFMLDEARGISRVIVTYNNERTVIDFSVLRGPDLESDLHKRDFTVNALALDLAQPQRLIDPTGGGVDLRERVLRACSPDAFEDDPLRILRAVRQALSLRFHIEPQTLRAMRQAVPLLVRISGERLRDELFRMLEGPQPASALRMLDQLGVLEGILPELPRLKHVAQTAPHLYDVWEHTLAALQALEDLWAALVAPEYNEEQASSLILGLAVLRLGRFRQQFAEHFAQRLVPDRSLRSLIFLAVVYHDAGKPECASLNEEGRISFIGHESRGAELLTLRGEALALSQDEIQRLRTMINAHMRLHFLVKEGQMPSRRAIYRFFKDCGPAGVEVCLLSLADTMGIYGVTLSQEIWSQRLDVCRALLETYWERPEVVHPERLLSGFDIMQYFDLQPGPKIGLLLDQLAEAQAAGEINDRENAIRLIQSWLEQPENRL